VLRLAACLSLLVLGVVALLGQDRPSPADASQDHDGRGALAVLRRDGLLLPIASFDRDSWRTTWPVRPNGVQEIPTTLAGIPKGWWGTRWPDQWRAHLTSGDPVFLEVKAPTMYQVFCGPVLGLRTNYRSDQPLPPVPVDPFPKDGLAISGGVPLEPIETVSPSSPEWAAMAVTLLKEFDRVEDETIAGVRRMSHWRHPIPPEQRRTVPVRLESWYRSPSDKPGSIVSYVEAVRQYPPGPDDKGCGLETFVSGWLHHRDGQLMKKTQLAAKLTYCDRVGARYMLPFGRIRPRKETYWVFQLSGWEGEAYQVVAVRSEDVRYVLAVFAGGASRCR
jgi:hypothetical protein